MLSSSETAPLLQGVSHPDAPPPQREEPSFTHRISSVAQEPLTPLSKFLCVLTLFLLLLSSIFIGLFAGAQHKLNSRNGGDGGGGGGDKPPAKTLTLTVTATDIETSIRTSLSVSTSISTDIRTSISTSISTDISTRTATSTEVHTKTVEIPVPVPTGSPPEQVRPIIIRSFFFADPVEGMLYS